MQQYFIEWPQNVLLTLATYFLNYTNIVPSEGVKTKQKNKTPWIKLHHG